MADAECREALTGGECQRMCDVLLGAGGKAMGGFRDRLNSSLVKGGEAVAQRTSAMIDAGLSSINTRNGELLVGLQVITPAQHLDHVDYASSASRPC